MSDEPPFPIPMDLGEASETVATIERELLSGRVPRGRKPLRDAITLFRRNGRAPDAVRALGLLAEMEYRRGELERALTAARAGLRLGRQQPDEAGVATMLEQLSRLSLAAGEHGRAWEYAQERVRRAAARRLPRELSEALRRAAMIAWGSGNTENAVTAAEQAAEVAEVSGDAEARARAEHALGTILLGSGCPLAAHDHFTEALRLATSRENTIRLHLARGSASMCLGEFDAAARDYRRAQRLARHDENRRLEVETTAAIAAAEAARGHAEHDACRVAKAGNLAERAVRRSKRLRDTLLEKKVGLAREATAHGEAALTPTSLPESPKAAATKLVALATSLESQAVADACCQEVERLATLGREERPYHCDLQLPFTNEE
jgi:tetratricopeptide (TPR) repeat protein